MPAQRYESTLPHPPDEVFRWHERPGAFRRLLPPWEDVRVLRREGGLDGGSVELEVRKGPARFRATLRHTAYERGRLFRDEQVSGPLGRWVHTHRFLPAEGGGCRVVDEVEWEGPFGGIGASVTGPLVGRELDRLFAFRHRRLASDLARLPPGSAPGTAAGSGSGADARDGSRPTVAVSGASGFIGSALVDFLSAAGHRVLRLVRSREASEGDPDAVYWDPREGAVDADRLEGVGGVVHLAGEPLDERWTEEKKRRILESRVQGTDLLARTLAGLDRPPRVLVSASGSDRYGDRGTEVLTEASPPGEGFLADVVLQWEAATRPAESAGIRVVHLRSGMVLGAGGGAIGKMLLPFRLGVGGRLGSGRQYVSWIDLDDEIGLIHHALGSPFVSGPVNAVAPHPVTNATFTSTLGRVLGRPTLIPMPAVAVRTLFGEMGETLLLEGARIRPAAAEESGFTFHHPSLEDSLRHQLGRTGEPRPSGLEGRDAGA